jgi:purine-binding chemotaxis protein CheW
MNDIANTTDYVTFNCAGQSFGLPIERVQDVFKPTKITPVPLAAPEIAGVLNLRGRIVTAIDLANRLNLASRTNAATAMAIGIEYGSESFGLLVDEVSEVLKLSESERESNPINLDHALSRVSAGVFRLDRELLIVLDVDRILDVREETPGAVMSSGDA